MSITRVVPDMIQQATARLLGRTTAGTGQSEEISVGAGLSLSAGALSAVAGSDTTAGVLELATSAETIAGTDTARAVTPAGFRAANIVLAGAAVATTSGATVSLTTAVPSWAKRLTIALNGVSTSGTSIPLIQIGPTGGVETSGYVACSHNIVSNTGFGASDQTAGFPINSSNASNVISGSIILTLMDQSTNTWAAQGCFRTTTSNTAFTAGIKALAGALARVSLTTVGGTDTFDAGSANVIWE